MSRVVAQSTESTPGSRVDDGVNVRNEEALHAEVPPEQRDDEDDA